MITDRICLYESDETDFTTHGIADLETLITEIDVVEKGNTAFSLTACFDIADDRAMLIEKGRIIGCMTNNGTFEPFRIKETSKLMSEIEVYAEHIMFDLADNLIEDCYVDTKSGQFAGTHFLESTQFKHKFTFTSNISKIASSRMVRKDPITALISDEDNSFISRWGGELTVNQYDIKINEHGGEDRGFTINYSENMEGLNYNEDDSEVYTRCMPEGYDGLFLPEKYVDSDKLNDYITPKIRVVKFSDIKYVEKEYDKDGNDVTQYDPEDHTKNVDGEYVDIEAAYAALRQCARALFTEQHVDEPRRSCSADLTLYQDTEEYSSVSALLTLRLWDTVTVHHEQQNVDIQLQCIETHFNPLRGALTSVSLGDEVPSYSNSKDSGIDNETMQKIEEAVNNSNATGPSKSQVQEMINNAMKEATDKINSGLGGYVVKTREELLIMDTEDVNTATKVWRWNVNGLGYSSSGYAGPYYTAMTSDGKFVINEVTCQKFTASLINAGILRSVDNSSWFDLENGTFSWANGQIVFDGTELTIKIGSQTIDDVLDSVFTIIVNKEHQIVPLDSNSFPVDDGSYKFTFTVLKGNTTTETPCIVNKVTPKTQINGVSFTMSNNTCTMKVDKSVRMLGVNGDEFEVELQILDYTLTKTISWSTVLQGRDGKDGINGTNGISSYWHIKYAPVANPTREQMSEEVNTYIGTYVDNIEADSNDPESYTWSRLIGENGQDGIPGTNGTDGKTTYIHIKYSDDMVSFTANNGETPGKYMGQYVDFIETDSLVFNDYIWAQIKGNDGRDGVDGTNGTPGISSYFHVKYAPNNNPTADQMTDTPQEYIGTYVDSNVQDSNDPSKYTWVKIQGKDGTSITIDYTVETLPTTGEVGKYYYVSGTGILWRYEESGWVKLGKIQGPQGIPGTNGVDGKTQYLHIKYSNDNGATFTTNNGEDVGMYIGTYVDFKESDSNKVSDYKWARMRGEDGVNASFVKIVETSKLFTMPQGATEYSPSSIALTPQFTNCTFGKWQYSTNGGSSWTNVTNGLNGLTISNGVLSISNTSALYTDSITSVSFKVTASDGSSDVTTITRLKDGIDGTDGTDGKDGTNGVSSTNIILGNENHTFQATSDGKAVATSITFDIDGYVGATEKAVTIGTISNIPTGMTITKNGSGTTNASLTVKVTTSMTSLNGIVTVPCTCNGLTFNKQFTYSLSVPGRDGQDGINGTDGIDGTSSYFHIRYSPVANPTSSQMTETPDLYIGTYVDQSPTDSTDPSKYTWSKFQGVDGNNGKDGTPGVDGKDGTTYYLHIKYSNDGKTFTANGGETPGDYLGQYVDTTKADSTVFSKYTWKKIKGDQGDQGIRGPAGSSSYFHIRYSAIANPTLSSQMTETPSDYIGTYVDSNAADSTDPSRYTWSRFRGQDGNNGQDGTPGINGTDGKTYYLHIKYSNDGATFTSNNGEDPGAWLGQYVDENKADSTVFSKYTWAKIKGDDGANASYVRIDETSQVFLKAKGATAYTPASIKLTPVFTNSAYNKWQYSINNGSSWTNVTSGSNGLTISKGVLTVANTCNLFTSSVQSVIFKVTGTNNTADTMTLVRISDGVDGNDGATGATGASATNVQLSNENHTFAATSNGKAIASSITVDIYGFAGVTAKATTIGTISGAPTGMTITKNNDGTTYASLTIAVTTSMSTTAGTVSIPITCNGVTFNKVFTYSLSVPGKDGVNGTDGKDGADGADGKNGTNASYVMASPTTQFFKCPSDSTTYSPTSITITPSFVNCSYSSWQYSVDGGNVWANVTSGSKGLTISNGVLTIQSSSSLFTTNITSIAFKVNASGSKYDIVTISKLKDGNTGATGATGASAVNIILGNESHTFAASSDGKAVATSVATSVVGYKGTTQTACTIGTISGLPTGMTATINSNGTASASVTFTVTTSLTTKNGSITIPVTCGGITVNKIFSYSLAVAGANGTNGTNGTNAKFIKINAPTNVFKSTDGGKTFSPSTINLYHSTQNITFSKWQYSINGGSSWTDVTSGSNGLTISDNGLKIAVSSALFTESVTAVVFKALSTLSNIYDTLTVYKLYDRTDINDAFEQMKLTVTQSNTKWEAAFKNSNANNMLLNSDFKTGTSDDWIDNGGGISVLKANAFPFYGSTEYYLKTSFPKGMRYAHDVQLEPNTDYVYEGYIYVNASLTGTNISPLHFWIWKGATPTSTRLCTIVDYRQTLTSGRFVKCYVHFKTDNVTEALYGRFFVYHSGTASRVGAKRMSLKKGTVETEWTQHPNEVKSSVVSIDQEGIKVKHSEAGTYTQMDSDGFSIRDSETGDVFAWLSNKEQFTELKVDKVFANNLENIYEGSGNLYVDHSATVAGDGSADKPFNSFKQLSDHLEATPVINKDIFITVRDPGVEINEQLHLTRLKGTGFIKITLEGKLVIRGRGEGQPCIRLTQIPKWVWIVSGREFGSSTTGAVLCDAGKGHGIIAADVDRLEVDAMTISCANWGIKVDRTHLYTWHVDFGKSYNAVELQYQSIYYSSDDVGSCTDFVRLRSGSFAYWGPGTVRPKGNVQATNGVFYSSNNNLVPTASPRYSSSNPSVPTGQQVYTYTYGWTSHKTYAYQWSNWNDSDCKQGSWGYGLRGGHMFFDLSTIRSQMTGTVQDGNTITLTRANSGGQSGPANVYINGSTCSSANGTPSYGGQTLLGTLAWGETKTFTLPKAIVQGLVSGSYNSLAVYVNNTASNCYLNIVNCSITLKTKK